LEHAFYPQQKTQPAQVSPIGDKSVILRVVEEALSAGVEDIIIIAGPRNSREMVIRAWRDTSCYDIAD